MSQLSDERVVLSRFGLSESRWQIASLGNGGGLSGARIWRVRAEPISQDTEYCLRRWPAEHPTPEGLAWIHQQLARATAAGCRFLPVPLTTVAGKTFVPYSGHLWELTPWLPGEADFHRRPTLARLEAALHALARLHLALRNSAGDSLGPSPGIEYRWQQLQTLTSERVARLAQAIDDRCGPEIKTLAAELVEHAAVCRAVAEQMLGSVRKLPVAHQACVRDIWHDHVLFDDEQVSGIVDFGAMRVESPAGDIARLLGSLVRDDPDGWQTGLAAYEAIRPLTPAERSLLAAFDTANVTLAGIHWIGWLFVEGRQFEELDRVAGRLREIRQRAADLATGRSVYDSTGNLRGTLTRGQPCF